MFTAMTSPSEGRDLQDNEAVARSGANQSSPEEQIGAEEAEANVVNDFTEQLAGQQGGAQYSPSLNTPPNNGHSDRPLKVECGSSSGAHGSYGGTAQSKDRSVLDWRKDSPASAQRSNGSEDDTMWRGHCNRRDDEMSSMERRSWRDANSSSGRHDWTGAETTSRGQIRWKDVDPMYRGQINWRNVEPPWRAQNHLRSAGSLDHTDRLWRSNGQQSASGPEVRKLNEGVDMCTRAREAANVDALTAQLAGQQIKEPRGASRGGQAGHSWMDRHEGHKGNGSWWRGWKGPRPWLGPGKQSAFVFFFLGEKLYMTTHARNMLGTPGGVRWDEDTALSVTIERKFRHEIGRDVLPGRYRWVGTGDMHSRHQIISNVLHKWRFLTCDQTYQCTLHTKKTKLTYQRDHIEFSKLRSRIASPKRHRLTYGVWNNDWECRFHSFW